MCSPWLAGLENLKDGLGQTSYFQMNSVQALNELAILSALLFYFSHNPQVAV